MIRFLAACVLAIGVLSLAPAPADAEARALQLAQASGMDAPSTVDPGAAVIVALPEGHPGGRVELWGPVTQSGRGSLVDSVPAEGSTVAMSAPTRPGSYELRQVSPGGAVLDRHVLEVAATPIRLSVPQGMSAGLDTRVVWEGPANPGDMLRIVDPTTGRTLSQAAATGTPGGRNETVIRAPERLGDYELQYWSARRESVLRALPVTVIRGNVWLRAPAAVKAGERFRVDWTGPTGEHAFRIVDPLTDTVLTSEPGAEQATLTAPTRTGSYRLRYLNTETGHVFSDLPLKVTPR